MPHPTRTPKDRAANQLRENLAARRHSEILRRLALAPAVGVTELSAAFAVSRETIRRDLKALARRGALEVVHGGATRREAQEPALAHRAAENTAGKAAIGRLAAELVQDGMVVLLDSGTTTLAIAQALDTRRALTICTGSLAIAQTLCRVTGFRVYLFGGEVDANDEATSGIDAIDAVSRFRVDIAFLGGGGITADGEVTDYQRAGAELRSRMIAAANQAWFVLDRSKFGRLTPARIPGFWTARGLLVDAPLPAAAQEALAGRGLRMLVAGEGGLEE